MQIKKEEMKNSILLSGEKEFLEKGFAKASIRKIVKQAGTTTGNFYNYFENKEALFDELVKDDLNKFMIFINGHNDKEISEDIWDISNIVKWREMLKRLIVNYIPDFGKGLVILLDCSEGTKYENSKNDLILKVEEHFIEHLEEFNSEQNTILFARTLADQFIHGLIIIIRDYDDINLRNDLIIEHILFYMVGSMGLIGKLN